MHRLWPSSSAASGAARGYVGAALMLLSLVMMEVDLDGLLHKKTPPAAAFDGKGALYAAARPDYPQALAQMMQERLHLTAESTVADIGAGTGKWTARLLPLGCRICAVEPNGSMAPRSGKAARRGAASHAAGRIGGAHRPAGRVGGLRHRGAGVSLV